MTEYQEIPDPTYEKIQEGDLVTAMTGDRAVSGIAEQTDTHTWLTSGGWPLAVREPANEILKIERPLPDYEEPDLSKYPLIQGIAKVFTGDDEESIYDTWVVEGPSYRGLVEGYSALPAAFTHWQPAAAFVTGEKRVRP